MARIHLLTVGDGDCSIIEHSSGRITVIDICGGNLETSQHAPKRESLVEAVSGNFRMCGRPTNPIDYLVSMGVKQIFRFILTHPEMDHLDGFNNLIESIPVLNIWDSGVRREKPDFGVGPYKEEDWDRYVKVRDGREAGISSVFVQSRSRFHMANQNEDKKPGGDGLYIASPNASLVQEANECQSFNDASYVISYRSSGGLIVFPGDSHDKSWEYILENNKDDVENAAFMQAPHHGRGSDREFDFLGVVNPMVSLLGCAPSEHLAYGAWKTRDLFYLTQNQTGNIILEIIGNTIEVYIQNQPFVSAFGTKTKKTNAFGYFYLGDISKHA